MLLSSGWVDGSRSAEKWTFRWKVRFLHVVFELLLDLWNLFQMKRILLRCFLLILNHFGYTLCIGVTFIVMESYYGSFLQCNSHGEEWTQCKLLVLLAFSIAVLTSQTIWILPLLTLLGNAGKRKYKNVASKWLFSVSFQFKFSHIAVRLSLYLAISISGAYDHYETYATLP